MEATEQVAELKPLSGHAQQYARGETLVRVEIDCQTSAHPIDGGFLLSFGKQIVTVPTSLLPSLMAQVEDRPEEIEDARRRHAKAKAKYIAELCEGYEGDALTKRRESLDATYPGSVEAELTKEHDRDVKPLKSCRVLGEPFAPPAIAEAAELQDSRDIALARAIASATAAALAPLIERLAAAPAAAAPPIAATPAPAKK